MSFKATLKSRGVSLLKLKPTDSWLGSQGRGAMGLRVLPSEADGSMLKPVSRGMLPLAAGGKISVYMHHLCLGACLHVGLV